MDAIPVLLVDENPTFLRIATHLLREYHSDELTVVGTSAGYDNALHQANRLKPHVVLVGIDQSNQDGEGIQCIARLRAALPNVCIIVLGTLDMETHRQTALDAGADSFITRSALGRTIMPTIRSITGIHAAQSHGSQRFVSGLVLNFMPIG